MYYIITIIHNNDKVYTARYSFGFSLEFNDNGYKDSTVDISSLNAKNIVSIIITPTGESSSTTGAVGFTVKGYNLNEVTVRACKYAGAWYYPTINLYISYKI